MNLGISDCSFDVCRDSTTMVEPQVQVFYPGYASSVTYKLSRAPEISYFFCVQDNEIQLYVLFAAANSQSIH